MAFGLVVGFLLLGGVAFACVVLLQRSEANAVKRTEGEEFERHWTRVVDRLAQESMGAGETLDQLGARLAAAALGSPVVWDLWLVRPDGQVVLRYSQAPGEAEPGCIGWAKLHPDVAERMAHEHPRDAGSDVPTGCHFLPVRSGGKAIGTVVFHTLRSWLGEAQGRTAAVAHTALSLGVVFAVFYVGLGAILLFASARARAWRRRAERAERIQALGAMADGINHEVRNPLNGVALAFQYLLRKGADGETREVVESARQQAARIQSTLDEFVRFTRVSRLDVGTVDLARVAAAAAPGWRLAGAGTAEGDERKLGEAFAEVAAFVGDRGAPGADRSVAVDAGRRGWRVALEARVPGLDPNSLGCLFNPYWRSKANDVGRGLAWAQAIVQAHGGSMDARLHDGVLTVVARAPLRAPAEAER